MAIRVKEPPPPEILERDDGGGPGWVELMRAANDIDAHLLVGALNEAGIETMAVKDHSAPAWLYGGSNPWAPTAVFVRKIQLEDARIALAELSYNYVPAREERPPVPERRGPKLPLVWWTAALLLGLFFTGMTVARTAELLDACNFPLICPAEETDR